MANKSTKKTGKKAIDKDVAKAEPKKYAGPILVLKTTKDGGVPHWDGTTSDKGEVNRTAFRWPRSGVVEAPDWNSEPKCGGGLHGLEFGEGTWSLLSEDKTGTEEWRVILVQPDDFIRLSDGGDIKIKMRRGEVVYCGNKAEALARVMCGKEAMERAKLDASSGDASTAASSGYASTAASSGHTSTAASSGHASKAASSGDASTAASSGHASKAASSGDYSKAASSGDYSTAASSGDYSTAASSGYASTAASSGYYSKAEQKGSSGIAAAIGDNVRAKAGENGLLILTWWDVPAKRFRACVGEAGIDGIEADAWYKVENGKIVKVTP